MYKQTKPKTHLRVLAIGLGLGLDFQAVELELDFQVVGLGLGRQVLVSGKIDRCGEYHGEEDPIWADRQAEWAYRAWWAEMAAEAHRGENPWLAGASAPPLLCVRDSRSSVSSQLQPEPIFQPEIGGIIRWSATPGTTLLSSLSSRLCPAP